MTDETNDSNVIPMVAPAAADTPQAEEAMQNDAEGNYTEAELLAMGYVPMDNVPRYYKYNTDNVKTIEDVVEFIKEMNVSVVLYGDQTLESVGRSEENWTEFEFTEDDDATPTDI